MITLIKITSLIAFYIVFFFLTGHLLSLWNRTRCEFHIHGNFGISKSRNHSFFFFNLIYVPLTLSGSTVLHQLWHLHGQVLLRYLQILRRRCKFHVLVLCGKASNWLIKLSHTNINRRPTILMSCLSDFKESIPLQ